MYMWARLGFVCAAWPASVLQMQRGPSYQAAVITMTFGCWSLCRQYLCFPPQQASSRNRAVGDANRASYSWLTSCSNKQTRLSFVHSPGRG